ncbi:DUF4231 domain-containing protein [Streptomyces niveus]|uniref:DUF4231 domain-containing protein n=1 Tax=Streptomyces niveus TaxID=193462 RepID=UPI0035DC0464
MQHSISVVGGALVPVSVNLDLPFAKLTATVLSLIVVGSVSLESVYRYREQWKNYRSTEQLLGHERIYFETKVGPYLMARATAGGRGSPTSFGMTPFGHGIGGVRSLWSARGACGRQIRRGTRMGSDFAWPE